MTIQRYNQGFGGFGPLEECKDGKLVKHSDHMDRVNKIIYDSESFNGVLKKEISARIDALVLAEKELKKANRYFVLQTINAVVLFIAITTIVFTK